MPGVTLIIPAASINRDAIVGIAHKYILDLDIRAGHHIDAVRPSSGAEGFDVADRDMLGFPDHNGIMGRINDNDSFDGNMLGEQNLNGAIIRCLLEVGHIDDPAARIVNPVHDRR